MRECGSDGCGGSCGTCAEDERCSPSGRCYRPPQPCDGRECGVSPAGDGEHCGTCPTGRVCGEDGRCYEATLRCNVWCPPLAGHTARCNAQNHCRYRPEATVASGASVPADPTAPDAEILIWVPPWAFPMGASDPGLLEHHGPHVGPERTVSFSRGFFIDWFPVTAGQFANFLSARGTNACDGEPCLRSSSSTTVQWHPTGDTGQAAAAEDCENERTLCSREPDSYGSCRLHPATGVTWYGARAYCGWRNMRLCTEAEWERAARGIDDRLLPWTDEWWGGEASGDPADAWRIPYLGDAMRSYFVSNYDFYECDYLETDVFANANGCYACWADVESETEGGEHFLKTAPVTSFSAGASPVGCWDMLGNAEEWVEDAWHDTYDGAPADGSEAWTDGSDAYWRVTRGGDWQDHVDWMHTVFREPKRPAGTSLSRTGFRCCRSLDP